MDDVTDERDRVRTAVRQVRREGYKAAAVYAAADAAAAALAAALVVRVLFDPTPSSGIGPAAMVAVAVGVVVFLAELWVRGRRSPVERFEAANPEVSETLRTARDAAADGQETVMAGRLYGETIERLRSTSSLALVDTRRVGAAVVLALALSLLTVQASVADVNVGTLDLPDVGAGDQPPSTPSGGSGGPDSSPPSDAGGLRDGSEILGEPENVTAGSVNVSAAIQTDGGSGEDETTRSFESGGLPSASTQVEAERAGFAPQPELEDADIVREYSIRIRDGEDDE